mmetsp:Transcript_38458/g.110929  ORF Transcript_38458/g.110929 Transcript_38458/m.110929 type:complete len:167 (-) Transcript_38458:308-808(-)
MAAAGLLVRGVLLLLLHDACCNVAANPDVCNGGAETACAEDSALLQTRVEALAEATPTIAALEQYGKCVAWRVAPTGSRARTCDEVCTAYGAKCTTGAFSDVKGGESMRRATKMATGGGCKRFVWSASRAAPFLDEQSTCTLPRKPRQSTCNSKASGGRSRVCPCS